MVSLTREGRQVAFKEEKQIPCSGDFLNVKDRLYSYFDLIKPTGNWIVEHEAIEMSRKCGSLRQIPILISTTPVGFISRSGRFRRKRRKEFFCDNYYLL